MIFIDFETRSKCILQDTGAWRYAEDPSTDVLCMAWAVDDGPVEIWIPGEGFPFTVDQISHHDFEAHHSFFERAIWRNVMIKKYGWPDIPDAKWRCSAATAAYHALPRALNQIGDALGLANVKDMGGKRVMMRLSRPVSKCEGDEVTTLWNDKASDFRLLYQYCKDDVAAERDVHRRLRPLPPSEAAIWALDQRINERGVRVDLPAVRAAVAFLNAYEGRLKAEFKTLTGIESPTMVAQLKTWLGNEMVDVTSLDKAAVETAMADLEGRMQDMGGAEAFLWEPAYRALEIRQALAKTSTAKYQAILDSVCSDGRLRGLLMYHGATPTGRWAGQLVQPQNFPKNTFKGDLNKYYEFLKTADLETFEMCYPVMETLSSTIRGVFIPSPGHIFFGGDYNAIEARVVFWLASESRGLQMFREGADIYKDMAAGIYGIPVEQITRAQRELGKQGILGCGFGMGADKFIATCWSKAKIVIDKETADRAVTGYRTKYRTVAVLWQLQELAAKQAIDTKKPVRCGKVLWAVHDGFLFCRLPSGRCMAYYDPKIEPVKTSWGEMKPSITFMGINSKTKQWERESTYGGKIVENITQAVARDIMAEAMLRVEPAGFKVALHTHDELLTEYPSVKNEAAPQVKTFEFLMATPPAWADGLPIKVEGWTNTRYTK